MTLLFKEKHGGKGVDVQSTIEAPHLYMLGASVRCKRFLSSKAIASLNVLN